MPTDDLSTPTKYQFTTTGDYKHQFVPITCGSIQFTVKANNDARIALATKGSKDGIIYEIHMGCLNNTKTAIQKKEEEVAVCEIPDILSGDKHREFWIKWNHGTIGVGKKDNEPFIQWKDPEPLIDQSITHYGVCTFFGASGEWVIEDYLDILTQDGSEYSFQPIMWGRLDATVKAPNDGLIALTSGPKETSPMYHIVLGGTKNKISEIQRAKGALKRVIVQTPDLLSAKNQKLFIVTWLNGVVKVFYENRLLMLWEDVSPFLINHFGVATWRSASGDWDVSLVLEKFTIPDISTPINHEFTTPGIYEYQFTPISSGSINFSVKTKNDAHIVLTDNPKEKRIIYQIIIGGWGNRKSAIRRQNEEPEKVNVATPHIVTTEKHKEFWIKWNGTSVAVGRGGSPEPFLHWNDSAPFFVTHYGVCSKAKATGNWLIEDFLEIETKDESDYIFNPISWGRMDVTVKALHDGIITLTSGPRNNDQLFEICLGEEKNTKSVFRHTKEKVEKAKVLTPSLLSETEDTEFLITWLNGFVRVFHDSRLLLAWDELEPLEISHFGVCTLYDVKGQWNISTILNKHTTSALPRPGKYHFKTTHILEYQFKPITSGSIHFTVKAKNDANIALSTSPNKTDIVYEVHIGGGSNTNTAIRRKRDYLTKAFMVTPKILRGCEHRGFWVKWSRGSIAVGKKGEPEPFLQWNDPEPFSVTHYGICTCNGANGEWVIEDFLKIDTQDGSDYIYNPILWGRMDLHIKAPREGHIALTTAPNYTHLMYQIVLGSLMNTETDIRYGTNQEVKSSVNTPKLLSHEKYKEFFITWFNGFVKVFHDNQLLVAWEDSDPFGISYFGVATWHRTMGDFVVSSSLDKPNVSELFVSEKCELVTPAKFEYQYKSITSGSINFTVKAKTDALIALNDGSSNTDSKYEIFIGSWGNSKTGIRKKGQGMDKGMVETFGILSGNERRGFWITWKDGNIAVGKKGNDTPIIRWVDSKPLFVTHYGVLTKPGVSGEWVIEDFLEIKTQDKSEYDFRPILWGRVDVIIKAPRDGHVALTSGPEETVPMYQIVFGCYANTGTDIRYGKEQTVKAAVDTPAILSNEKFKSFLITWFNGNVRIYCENQLINLWKDYKPFGITHVGVSTWLGAVGYFTLSPSLDKTIISEISTPEKHHFITSGKKEYFYRSITYGLINFTVKASNNAHIALTDDPHKSTCIYEIIIGKNRNLRTTINKEIDMAEKAVVETPNILKGSEHRGFWIRWNDGNISVGKKGKTEPFITWDDPEPFFLTHYGVSTRYGANGEWIIEDVLGIKTIDEAECSYRPLAWGHVDLALDAPHDGHIALTSGPSETISMYQIYLGSNGNKECDIRYGTGALLKATVNTPEILSQGKDKLFNIIWYNGFLRVYSENRLLIAWEDSKPFEISHFGVCTSYGSVGHFTISSSMDTSTVSVLPTLDKYHFTTPGKYDYQYEAITSGSIHFTIKASNDAHIALTDDSKKTGHGYEIVIGEKGTKTTIYKGTDLEPKAFIVTPDILSSSERRGFWIKWSKGSIAVGKSKMEEPFMQWFDPKPLWITHYGVCTHFGGPGEWMIEDFLEIKTQDGHDYNFYPILWGRLDITINAPFGGLIALTHGPMDTDPMYEISLGGHENTISEIRRAKGNAVKVKVNTPNILAKGKDKLFVFTWMNGFLKVFHDNVLLMQWEDPEPFRLTHFGVATWHGSTGDWTASSVSDKFTISVIVMKHGRLTVKKNRRAVQNCAELTVGEVLGFHKVCDFNSKNGAELLSSKYFYLWIFKINL